MGRCGIVLIFRNDEGKVVKTMSWLVLGYNDSAKEKSLVMLMAMDLAKDSGFKCMIF